MIWALRHGRVAVVAESAPLYAADMADDPASQPQPNRAESIVTHAENSISEDAIVAAARDRAVETGAGAVTPAVGALLSVLAKLSGAKAVVEVGTGAGVSGLWLLSGMREDGVLTTIDVEPEHQRIAKQAFTEAGIGPSRTRLISGRAQEVLTRLADESYDLVFIDADPVDQPDFVVGRRAAAAARRRDRRAPGGAGRPRGRRQGTGCGGHRGAGGRAADRRGRAADAGAGAVGRRSAGRGPRLADAARKIAAKWNSRSLSGRFSSREFHFGVKIDFYGILTAIRLTVG